MIHCSGQSPLSMCVRGMGVRSLSVARIRRVAARSRGFAHMRDPAVAVDVGSGSGLIRGRQG